MNKDSINELNYLGKEVKVVVDRPIHSLHPEYGFEYLLNYGYLPNTLGGDGEEIDAYIIGEEKPLKEYNGIVKAVLIRENDNDNKLIVTSLNNKITKEEIISSTFFQEQYFKFRIVFLEEK